MFPCSIVIDALAFENYLCGASTRSISKAGFAAYMLYVHVNIITGCISMLEKS